MITWIIGSGGLLGGALARQSHSQLYRPGPIPWRDAEQARATLHHQARRFEQHTQGERWRVIWAAGAATTATKAAEVMSELKPLEGLLTGLRSALPRTPGSFVLTSSAGGVYAGAEHPPFTVDTPTAPLSPYGELKLAQEGLTESVLGGVTTMIISRVSNLYGPGQNLTKVQGLISHLAKAAITRQPVNIFVPLGTTRDYIYSDDAARAILQATDAPPPEPITRMEILASGRGTTISQLIRVMNDVTKKKVPVALGSHASAKAQAPDLRMIPSMDLPVLTTLPAGVKAVHDDLLHRSQQAEVHHPAAAG